MKNKALTYLLILSVSAVWGIIFYRVFSATDSDEVVSGPLQKSTFVNESLDDYKLKDTFTLALNYGDPFLENSSEAIKANEPASQNTAVAIAIHNPQPIAPQVNWDAVKYTGYVLNSSDKRVTAIMTLNGKEYMLSEGQDVAGLKLLKNLKDSVKVIYQGKTKFIRIQ
ncbi:hypothetical protein ACFSJU_07670 [Paradesertivirga mongoliensis]|uniref:Type II secretion system protein GspC N-terminal domain-containing protein n=1 Tax=Paradesertivirga mongoliensis TaxID=2100740 RepID=A0ABW4ZKW2_9SPHI|nr:hypothetical protein [Pedobacter mongoliensis]